MYDEVQYLIRLRLDLALLARSKIVSLVLLKKKIIPNFYLNTENSFAHECLPINRLWKQKRGERKIRTIDHLAQTNFTTT